MSYCVNCGVELEKSLAQCPLCGVEVLNPKEPHDAGYPKPYSNHIARIERTASQRIAIWVVTVIIVLAGVICAMTDLVYSQALTWSVYVIGALALLWVLVLLPLLYRQLNLAVLALVDICAVLLFLYVVNLMDAAADWYMKLAMPLVLLLGLVALGDIAVYKSPRVRGWQKVGLFIMSGGVVTLGLEVLLDLFNDMTLQLTWSWFVILPAFALGLVFFLAERRRELKEEIYKRLRL